MVGERIRTGNTVRKLKAREVWLLFDGEEPDGYPYLLSLGDRKETASLHALLLLIFGFHLGLNFSYDKGLKIEKLGRKLAQSSLLPSA